jgi:hypothetical protein
MEKGAKMREYIECLRLLADAFGVAGFEDEVGFMVRWIEEDGFLRLSPLGGWDERILLAQRVTMRCRDGHKVPGVIGTLPPHLLSEEERKRVVSLEDMFVDIGARDRAEAEGMGVGVGEDYVTGKAFDDRAGCVVAVEALRVLAGENLPYRLAVNFAVCEEGGLRGARTLGPSTSSGEGSWPVWSPCPVATSIPWCPPCAPPTWPTRCRSWWPSSAGPGSSCELAPQFVPMRSVR